MAANIDLIKQRLAKMQKNTKQSKLIWKPSLEEQIIRIVPYKFSPDNPFIELFFHYGITARGFLSPQSFGRPDPFVKLSEELKMTGEKDKWKQAKKIEPKLRTFAPVIIRGKESEGVKFWGFGKTVYTELLTYFANADYGDLSDPLNGRDITVYQTKEPGKDFPTTHLIIKPNVSPLTEDVELAKFLHNSQKDITEIYEEKTYKELEQILENWIAGGSAQQDNSSTTNAASTTEAATTSNAGATDATQTPPATPTQTPPAGNSDKAENIASAFDELFNK